MTSLLRTNLLWGSAQTPVWKWGEGNNPTTWGLPLLPRLLTLMAEAQPHSCLSRLLLTPLFIPGRIDFPWKLSDMKGLLALWCQHSVIPLSVFLYSVSGTLFSPRSLFLTFLFHTDFSPPFNFTWSHLAWWLLLSYFLSTSWSHSWGNVWKTH